MRVVLFEDDSVKNLHPVALMRPAFELVCGRMSLRERFATWDRLDHWGVFVRPYLAETYREQHPTCAVNDWDALPGEPTLLVNGRWLGTKEALDQAHPDNAGIIGETVCWLLLTPEEASLLGEESLTADIERIARSRTLVQTSGVVIEHPWDLVDENPGRLTLDFEPYAEEMPTLPESVAIIGPRENVTIHADAKLDPFVVLDATHGPISIAAGAHVQSFTRIEGPCHIAEEAQLFKALVREGTTIGPVCRVGGEIEASILHGYANKYHEGFLGHSYVCPWVNLGALTTNSDLKNDYSAVRVPLEGQIVESERMKIGSYIGDHTKTGLGTLFNTGSSVGIFTILLPGGELLPKFVPSFSRVWHGELTDGWELERLMEIARTAMARRDKTLSTADERLIRYLAKMTQNQRGRAIHRDQQKRATRRENSTPMHWA